MKAMLLAWCCAILGIILIFPEYFWAMGYGSIEEVRRIIYNGKQSSNLMARKYYEAVDFIGNHRVKIGLVLLGYGIAYTAVIYFLSHRHIRWMI